VLSAAPVFPLAPTTAGTAMLRFAFPFGGPEWPKQTQLEIDPVRTRIGRSEPFEVRGRVRGVIPEKASVVFRVEGSSGQSEQICAVTTEDGVGRFSAQLRPAAGQRNFLFH